MTALDQWRALLADIEAATGPFDMRKADALAGGLKLGLEFESIDLLLTGLQAGTEALGAVVALVEREMPGWGHQVGRPLQTYKHGYYASVFREATEDERASGLWMPGHYSAGREYGANYSENEMCYFPIPAFALLAAFARAKVAELEAGT